MGNEPALTVVAGPRIIISGLWQSHQAIECNSHTHAVAKPDAAYRAYFLEQREMAETVPFDILAPMEVIKRFGFEGVARFRQRVPEQSEVDR